MREVKKVVEIRYSNSNEWGKYGRKELKKESAKRKEGPGDAYIVGYYEENELKCVPDKIQKNESQGL